MKPAKCATPSAAALSPTPAARADDRFEKTFSRTLTYRGGRVSIENRFGAMSVRTGNGNNVSVRAIIRSSDAEIGRSINVETSDGPGGITVKTVVPEIHHKGSL